MPEIIVINFSPYLPSLIVTGCLHECVCADPSFCEYTGKLIIRGAIRNTCLLRKDSSDCVVGMKGQEGSARNTLEQEITEGGREGGLIGDKGGERRQGGEKMLFECLY